MWKKILTLSLIFVISVVLLIALSLYSFQRFDSYVQYTDAVNQHHVVLKQLHSLKVDLIAIENNERAYLLFDDTVFYDRFKEHQLKIRETFSELYKLTRHDAQQQKHLQRLNMLIKSRIDFLNTGIVMGYPPTDYQKGKENMDLCISVIGEIETYQHAALAEQLKTKEVFESTTPLNFRIVFITTMAVFAISFGLLIQQYRDRIKYQEKLEKNLIELNQINSEWEQIGHVASHDLQEPLRKIRTFSDLLMSRNLEQLDKDGQTVVTRINAASSRAQSLMADIVNYTNIVRAKEDQSLIDLNKSLDLVLNDMGETIARKNASVYYHQLPQITALPGQIPLLFQCLIDNSLKFSNGRDSKINITADVVQARYVPVKNGLSSSEYHKIVIEDNGIGFENQFSEKIFKMFQRLHPQDSPYEGRGIGLALVKRIMTNHLGFVVARGRPGKGAIFTLYFPVH